MRTTERFINAAHFLDHYFLLIFPTAVLAIHVEWGMSYGEALALGTPAFVAFALATPVSGWLGDRWGEAPMMIVFFIGIGLSSMLTGSATGPVALAAGLSAIGLFASIYHPVGTAYLVGIAERTGRSLGVNGVFGNLGVAAAAGLTGLIAASFGWRMAFVLPGAVALAIGVWFALHTRSTAARNPTRATVKTISASRAEQIRVLTVVAIASLFGGLAFNGVTIALPKLFEERLVDTTDLAEIGLVASLVFALAAFTQIPVGRLIDRIGAKPVMVTLTAAQAMLFVALSQSEGSLAVVVAVPLMLSVFGEVPVSAWLVSRYVAPEWRGRIYSIQFMLALGVSAAVVPLISLLHAWTGGQAALFVVLGAAMAVVFASAWALPARRETSVAIAPQVAQ